MYLTILLYNNIILILFLTAVLFTFSAKPLVSMLRYFVVRQSFRSSLALILYLSGVLYFMGMVPLRIPYPPLGQTIAGLFIVLFPHLFSSKGLVNPYKFVVSSTSFKLLGAGMGDLPINAPELGIFLVGAPGCGKTKYMIEPIIFSMIRKGYSGVLYDYDFHNTPNAPYSLSQLAYHCSLHPTKTKAKFLSINFQNLQTSSRINPIAPKYIQDRKKLSHYLHTFLLNLNPHLARKEDFWHKNTYALLKSLVVFLSNRHPLHCSLPHVIMLGLQSSDLLMRMLCTDEEAKLYASPVLDALENASEQFAGVMANFKVSLERLLDPSIFWVLSGDDVPHVINDPQNPHIVCLGNTPTAKEALSPVIAMTMSVLTSNMYGHDRNKSFLMIDELPTLFLPNLNEVPATARKYNIATVVALQTLAQLEKTYGVLGAKELQETFGNHFIGRSPYRLSKALSDMFGKQESTAVSKTTSAAYSASKTTHKKDKAIVSPQAIMSLKVGEFVGQVAESGRGFFKVNLQPIGAYDPQMHHKHFKPLPVVHAHVDEAECFAQVQEEVKQLADQYSTR